MAPLIQYAALGALIMWVAIESAAAHRRAALDAHRAHLRLDRMQREQPLAMQKTVRVDYVKGFDIKDDWSDDFRATRVPKD